MFWTVVSLRILIIRYERETADARARSIQLVAEKTRAVRGTSENYRASEMIENFSNDWHLLDKKVCSVCYLN